MFKELVMDLVYLALAAAFWLAVWGLARACAFLQQRQGQRS
jgi:hypothetical protein